MALLLVQLPLAPAKMVVLVSSAELRQPVPRREILLLDTARGLQDVIDEKGIERKDLVRSRGEKIELRS